MFRHQILTIFVVKNKFRMDLDCRSLLNLFVLETSEDY